ncbi:TIGR03643 family protein [Lyngbya confervoides]|uniref:TIGR03643 family protein n=1 Tax=Lyngbya confervoides BDU141951 TaxID=1574623 RepID=A0ABD4T930_9CYAN|nr:TIGR03643 family protein [Lyngbya confervoides]MCM1984775.1 TIGR03643 family protein [Lyngbya confervoides BDU141951]
MKATKQLDLDPGVRDRIIEMAWEDRTPFEAIAQQFGLSEQQVIALMRREMKPSSFRMWRKRVSGRKTKHAVRHPELGSRLHCATQKQRMYGPRR